VCVCGFTYTLSHTNIFIYIYIYIYIYICIYIYIYTHTHTYKLTHYCSQASITWTITPPDSRDLPIQSYTVRHAKASSLSSYKEHLFEGTTIVVSNLNASTTYVAWVRACTSAGCSNYSTYSVLTSTLAVPAADTLAQLANVVQVCVNYIYTNMYRSCLDSTYVSSLLIRWLNLQTLCRFVWMIFLYACSCFVCVCFCVCFCVCASMPVLLCDSCVLLASAAKAKSYLHLSVNTLTLMVSSCSYCATIHMYDWPYTCMQAAASSGGLGVNVTEMTVQIPPKLPEAPSEDSKKGALNQVLHASSMLHVCMDTTCITCNHA
jgi:hypothetical protein